MRQDVRRPDWKRSNSRWRTRSRSSRSCDGTAHRRLGAGIVQAHAVPEDNKLFITEGSGNRYWAMVARSLLSVLSPETEASSLSAPLMWVLSARSVTQAQNLPRRSGVRPSRRPGDHRRLDRRERRHGGGVDDSFDDDAGADAPTGTAPADHPAPQAMASRRLMTMTRGLPTRMKRRTIPAVIVLNRGPGARTGGRRGTAGKPKGSGTGAARGKAMATVRAGPRTARGRGRRTQAGFDHRGGRCPRPARRGEALPAEALISYVLPRNEKKPTRNPAGTCWEEDDWHGLGKLGIERVEKEEQARLGGPCAECGRWEVRSCLPITPATTSRCGSMARSGGTSRSSRCATPGDAAALG